MSTAAALMGVRRLGPALAVVGLMRLADVVVIQDGRDAVASCNYGQDHRRDDKYSMT